MLSQQQKVTKFKYVKDAGHAVIDQTDADDIIKPATTQGIYNLTLGLSDKERWALVAGRAHEASAITSREAKEGFLEAHSLKALITSTHSKNEKKRDTTLVAMAKSLEKLVFSIRTTTLKVTKEEMEESKEEDTINEEKIKCNKKESPSKAWGCWTATTARQCLLRLGRRTKTCQTKNQGKQVQGIQGR
jgi:hypothetical protein